MRWFVQPLKIFALYCHLLFLTCYNPCVPLLKFITAEDTPMRNVVRPTNIYFGHLFEIILYKDLLLF